MMKMKDIPTTDIQAMVVPDKNKVGKVDHISVYLGETTLWMSYETALKLRNELDRTVGIAAEMKASHPEHAA